MTEIRTKKMWHVYGMVIPEGHFLAGCWWTLTITLEQPQEMPRTWRLDWKDLGVAESDRPLASEAPYLASFDHDPTEEEMNDLKEAVLGPDEAAQYD